MEIDYKRESLLLTSFNGKKRKKNADHHHNHNVAKRVKSERGGAEETEEVEPRISVLPDRLRHPITAEELTELLHYAALGGTRVKQPSWCVLLGQRRVKGVNVVVVEEVSQSDFYKHYITLRNLRSKYSNRLTFTLSTSSSSSSLLLSTIFSSEVDSLEQLAVLQEDKDSSKLHKALRTHPVVLKYGTSKRGLTAYMLTQEEMIKRHYPVKGLPGFEDFACADCADVTDASPLFGLDCEMCLTVKGYELTRVSLVEGGGKCVMDQLVKPDNKILDYLTQFSGITAAMLHPVRTSLRDVQVQLRTLLPRDAVLVGHAVNNDLVALKLIHRHVIDTSLLYGREFGQRFKLKLLAEVVLGRSIQTQGEKGHHPVEDALAALDLAKYFIRKSPLKDHLEELWGLTQEEEEEEEESTCRSTELAPSSGFADVLQRAGRSVCYVGKRCDITLHPAHQQWHNSDRQVVASFRRQSNCPFFSVLRLSSFSNIPPRQDYEVRWCLQDMCVVFAGPLPAGFSEREVRRLFRRCGSVRTVKMLTTTHRIHAVVEFELLEGAALALQMLNGATVQGHTMKVQRPVTESTLDFDVYLDALMSDAVNARRLYTLKLNCRTTPNGHIADGKFAVNGCTSESLPIKKCELSEEALTQTFTRFGIVERILLMGKPGRQARHAYIQFERSEAKQAAIESSEGLWQENYVTCPALTPVPVDEDGPHELRGQIHAGPQDMAMCHMMKKLDARLGKIFTSLPECTLSVVLLLAHNSAREPPSPGLCLLELKRGKSNNATT